MKHKTEHEKINKKKKKYVMKYIFNREAAENGNEALSVWVLKFTHSLVMAPAAVYSESASQ